MIDVRLCDDDSGRLVKVTPNGELVTSALEYSEPFYIELGVDDQIYNIVPAKIDKRFIITGMLLGADRNVTTDTSIHVYESTSATGTTAKDILFLDLNKGEHTYLNLFNVATQKTRWINATADDDDVDCTIFGYYVDN